MPSMTRRRSPPRRTRYGNPEDAALVEQTRARLGVSQNGLADLLGVTQGSVSHIETQERPLTHLLRDRIAQLNAAKHAVELTHGNRSLACEGADLEADEFIPHLYTCAKCLARATMFRTWDHHG